ncbi:MAG: SDR family oxidoreductase [Lentimicrobiaceae bacterium]|nr:SDR family oxidoreductase [Lentimicrobiaceae bacterium]MCP4909618.1 SDR family oxidoreductase [Bacteroidota bacterium]MBT3454791.1 SDR family oxidoreductase [Lentimicrobiaceae bacterium]MBT3819605.1 SDR family oxidoreductase [Lentimicrobiaceae bacterium]MBT4061317.1 SDR family oxidoreductase [Lentimicrobiaceae bacterium]
MMNIIITGASKGIGLEVAKMLIADNNNKIICISRTSDFLNLNNMFNTSRFFHVKADISKTNFSDSIIPIVLKEFSGIDIIINNAGILINKPFTELTDDDFDNSFNINVKGPFKLVRELLPHINEGAHILNITSMGGFQGSAKFPGLSLYSSSKGALAILSETMAEELKEYGIKSNALALGAVQTEMLANAFPGYEAPLQPKQMAEFIMEFALNGHKFFNGKILPVSISTP